MVVAMKMYDDVSMNNLDFAQIGGISLAEMNAMEMFLLGQLDYRMHISDSEYATCLASLEHLNEAIIEISSSPPLPAARPLRTTSHVPSPKSVRNATTRRQLIPKRR
eukprot:c3721_g1_i1.p2 GENE.c3721_g1_i1~~c3721_g1_i1.p2  ORF type:complete len:107 (+),score=15.95 c3721_g1_i1:379-699(+)